MKQKIYYFLYIKYIDTNEVWDEITSDYSANHLLTQTTMQKGNITGKNLTTDF